MKVQYHNISQQSYQNVWDFQTLLNNEIKQRKRSLPGDYALDKAKAYFLNHLIFCEHKPVYTLGKSSGKYNLLVDRLQLAKQGVECFDINRGGDITYHGPGQITGYLIFDLELLYRDVHRFVRNIEECIIQFLKLYHLDAFRLKDYTGVWLGNEEEGFRKICAIGVHLSRWVSMHGFALNINTELKAFDQIIPCGIDDKDKSVSSLSKELDRELDMEQCRVELLDVISTIFELDLIQH
ncbi:MAG: lipoyl(octanoyl) transferase LipB [Saprospiraceae bacterium]|jgi:lipoyl(octanoyl) transferase|nr:lipoyl(octanoyl) transferase LipB [Chitinophagia bacterium]